MPFRHLAAAALTTTALVAVPAAAHAADVTIANKSFGPSGATVAPGGSVTWHWGDGPHNVRVTQGPAQFDSGFKDAGATYTRQFTAAGVYSYQCDAHPSMRGQVTVVAAGSPAAAPAAAAPRLAAVRVSPLAVVHVTATAPATLQARILHAGRTVKRTTARLAPGANRIALPVRTLALGRYRVQVSAVDAAGHRSAPVTRSLVVTRAARRRPPVIAPVTLTPAPASAVAPADDHGHHSADHVD